MRAARAVRQLVTTLDLAFDEVVGALRGFAVVGAPHRTSPPAAPAAVQRPGPSPGPRNKGKWKP